MKTRLLAFFTLAALILATCLGINWWQSIVELDEKDTLIAKQAKEIHELQKMQAVSNATNDMLTRRLGQLSQTPFRGTILNELNAAERRNRIPAGATDPDKVWKGQMIRAQDTLQRAGMPATR